MNLLFIGDVVGSPGRDMMKEYLPKLKEKYRPHFTIINGENAAGGKGITEKIYREFLGYGAQAVTLEIIHGITEKFLSLSKRQKIWSDLQIFQKELQEKDGIF